MHRRLEATIDAGLRRSPAQTWFRRAGRNSLTVLAYHGIDEPETFARHADYIRQHYHPVSAAEVLVAVETSIGLPRDALLITFDDGDRSLLAIGVPILVERGLPGIAFVVAGLLDTDQPFWWDEAAALAAGGGRTALLEEVGAARLVGALKRVPDEMRRTAIEELRRTASQPAEPRPQLRRSELSQLESAGLAIGNHTLTHPCLDRCDPATVTREIGEADAILAAALGHPVELFAYPNGDWSEEVVEAVRVGGHRLAFAFDHRRSPWPPPDALLVSRVRLNSTTSLDRLAIILSGLHSRVHAALGRT